MLKKFIPILVTGLTVIHVNAQQDSLKIVEKETGRLLVTPTSGQPAKGEKEEKEIWKINLYGTLFSGLNISYERKITSKWTVNTNSILSFYSPVAGNTLFQGNQGIGFVYGGGRYNFSNSLACQIRYYYNQERRKRLSKRTGFSGNYFAFELSGGYSHSNDYYPNYNIQNSFLYSAGILYGIQRKIGKRAYIDGSVGLGIGCYRVGQYSQTLIMPSTKLGVGFAF
jgi:hypothetical protein